MIEKAKPTITKTYSIRTRSRSPISREIAIVDQNMLDIDNKIKRVNITC